MTPPPLVALEHIDIVYGTGTAQFRAVKDVSLNVNASEILALMGPSGSGKTSVLQVMGLLVAPARGCLRLRGIEVDIADRDRASRLRRECYGFVFQSYNLFPTLTALENVLLAFAIKGLRGTELRAEAAHLLEEVGLGDRLNHYPAELSGGQKQRVAIARALVGDPAIVLADEPTAALDSETGEKVMELLSGLSSARRAIVMVSHDSRVTNYVDRVICLHDGHLSEEYRP